MFDVIEVCETFAKKIKWFNKTTSVIGTNLKTSTDITGEISITAFVNGAVKLIYDFLLQQQLHKSIFKQLLLSKKNTMKLSCLLKAS